MHFDKGKGALFNGHEQPVPGSTYLPRLFEVGENGGDGNEMKVAILHSAKKHIS